MRQTEYVFAIGLFWSVVASAIQAEQTARASEATPANAKQWRETDIPVDAPQDSIMAGKDEIEQMHKWARAAFLGTGQPRHLLSAAVPFSFQYGGVRSDEAMKTWTRSTEVDSETDRDRHVVTWADETTGLRVQAEISVWKRYPAADWAIYFENAGKHDTPILEEIQTLHASVQSGDDTATLCQLTGDYSFRESYLPTRTVLEAGKSISLAPEGGRSSNRTFPFFNLECAGEGVIVAIGWSGQWAASLERDKDGSIRLRAGMEKTHLVLHPGERIRGPRILLMPWKGDPVSAQQRFRRLLMFQYMPKQNGRPAKLPLAAQWFDRYRTLPGFATEAGQLAAAKVAHEFGCDTFWIDALWFEGDFSDGVGNWYPKLKDFPNGLKPIADACHQMGMKFVLWFEPERAAKGSQIAQEHPEFVVIGAKENRGLFKLHDPAARRWLTDLLSRRITEYGVDIYRNDFNINPLDYWRRNDAPDRQGMTEIRYVEGLYTMWDELKARHPSLLIDNCASGGRRIDLETCMRSVPLFRSDTACLPGRAEWDQTQTQGLSLFIPVFGAAAWSPDAYVMRSATMAGTVCQFGYLGKDFSMKQARTAVAEARENRKYWYGDFYPLVPATTASDQWAVFQMHRADLDAGIVLAFRRGGCPCPTILVKLGGIDPAATYVVERINEARLIEQETLSGHELGKERELLLAQKASSLIVRYRKVTPGPPDQANCHF